MTWQHYDRTPMQPVPARTSRAGAGNRRTRGRGPAVLHNVHLTYGHRRLIGFVLREDDGHRWECGSVCGNLRAQLLPTKQAAVALLVSYHWHRHGGDA